MITTILLSNPSNKINYFLICLIIISVLSNLIVIKIAFNYHKVKAALKYAASFILSFSIPVPGVSIIVKDLSP